MATSLQDLEPCQFFNEGMMVWTLCRLKQFNFEDRFIPAKVVKAAGYSAYVENPHYDISRWIDLRLQEVLVRKHHPE